MQIKAIAKKIIRSTGYDVRHVPAGPTLEFAVWNRESLIGQDIFVLIVLQEKRGGFFVEFGAGNGIHLSNTYLLEKEFGWKGILAEPNRSFFPQVVANRSCVVDNRCVWSATGETLRFTETTKHEELSTISQFMGCDYHNRSDESPVEYKIETVSLNDLLLEHHAPQEIDYLSIDTEGSELEILRDFDFGRWNFNVITVEHNFVEELQSGIYKLLTSHGYTRVVSMDGDDWYVKNGLSISARGRKAHERHIERCR